MAKVTCWTDPGGCAHCRHCGMDMDMDPYCAHPTVIARHKWGLDLAKAIEWFCTPDLKLWEQRAPPPSAPAPLNDQQRVKRDD